MTKYYDKEHHRLIFIGHPANTKFWDHLWEVGDFEQYIKTPISPFLFTT